MHLPGVGPRNVRLDALASEVPVDVEKLQVTLEGKGPAQVMRGGRRGRKGNRQGVVVFWFGMRGMRRGEEMMRWFVAVLRD